MSSQLMFEFDDEFGDQFEDDFDFSSDSSSSEEISIDSSGELGDTKRQKRSPDRYNILDSLEKRIMKDRRKSLSKRPRMIITDVRDFQAKMFANVVNSGDLNLMIGMFKQYYSPNVSMNFRKYVPVKDPVFVNTFHSYQTIANLWFTLMNINPDAIVTLCNDKVVTQGNKSVLVMSFLYSATKSFNVETIHDVLPKMIVESPKQSQTEDCNYSLSVESELEAVKSRLTLRQKPIALLYEGQILMYFDPDTNQVTNMNVKVKSIRNSFSVEM